LTFEIELAGRRRAVDVRREGAAWVVTLDGRAVAVTMAEIGGRWSLLLTGPAEAGRNVESGLGRTAGSYEVSFEARGNGAYVVHVNGEPFPLSVVDPRRGARRRAHAADAGRGGNGPVPVVAPMPGRIVKVLVRPGDAVAARQGVVVVEAMKMENELRAPRAGNVTDVRVREGMSVEANAVLVVVE
jgi:biotin carboxyl carrier protein